MNKLVLILFLSTFTSSDYLLAQDTLPKFSVRNAGKSRIVIGWINNYPNVKQISIQRSFDSLNNYKTILTVPDPSAIQNGYMDTKATNDHMFYRIYILLDKGEYLFSAAKKPVIDTTRKFSTTAPGYDTIMVDGKLVIIPAKPLSLNVDILHWGDSATAPNGLHNKPPINAYIPSLHVYTNRDGYVRIKLPEAEKTKKYSIKFFDDNETLLFELKEIKENNFKIDKTNFYHYGWFWFELYEDGKLIEKHKFYLQKDFLPSP